MPTPGPINSQRCRSAGDPCASRGYQPNGTETVRPSCKSTVSARAETRTSLAIAASVAGFEVVMPCLQQFRLVLTDNSLNSVQFAFRKPVVVRDPDRRQPARGGLALAPNVDVRCLMSVAGKEEEPIRAAPEHGRAHGIILADADPSARVAGSTTLEEPPGRSAGLLRPSPERSSVLRADHGSVLNAPPPSTGQGNDRTIRLPTIIQFSTSSSPVVPRPNAEQRHGNRYRLTKNGLAHHTN
jgi:hypothetical protein